jgi:hypothetical protein
MVIKVVSKLATPIVCVAQADLGAGDDLEGVDVVDLLVDSGILSLEAFYFMMK